MNVVSLGIVCGTVIVLALVAASAFGVRRARDEADLRGRLDRLAEQQRRLAAEQRDRDEAPVASVFDGVRAGDRVGVYSMEGQCVQGIVTAVGAERVALREAELIVPPPGKSASLGVVTITAAATYMVQNVAQRPALAAVADAAESAG